MSGHSKWSTIKRQKGTTDIKRGMLFSKLSRAISLAAREGASPDTNFKLRITIEKARSANMPKENIERAIARSSGGESVEEVVYEGYGPGGIAVVVEAVSDNKNRTAQGIKNIFERGGGKLASPGAVSYQFEKTGQLLVKKTGDFQSQMLALIDAGVEDISETEDGIEVYIKPEQVGLVRDKINGLGFTVESIEIVMQPKTLVALQDEGEIKRAITLLENLQAHDDVQEVFSNLDIIKND